MTRLAVAVAVCAVVLSTTAANAEPILWGYRAVDADTGELREERFHLTETNYSEYGVAIPNPKYPGGPYPNGGIFTSSVRTRFTITDEISGQTGERMYQDSLSVYYWLKVDIWDSSSTWAEEGLVLDNNTKPELVLGRNQYLLTRARSGAIRIEVSPAPTTVPGVPEPTTLVLAGIGLAGLAGRRLRRRQR